MGFGGLIGGVMSGVGKGYTDYAESELKKNQELDLRKQLMDAEEMKQLRVDEIRRNRDVEDIGRTEAAKANAAKATAGTRAEAEVAGKVAGVDAAVTAGLPAKEAALTGATLEANKGNVTEKARQAGSAAAVEQTTKTDAPGYTASLAKETSAKESSGSKATAALAGFELTQKRGLADLRASLSKTTDPDQRALLEQQVRDLSGGSTKSYADMVTAGDAFRKLANNLREQLKTDPGTPEEEKSLRARIEAYEAQAASVLNSSVDRRLGGAATPRPAAAPAAPGAPAAPRPALNSFYK